MVSVTVEVENVDDIVRDELLRHYAMYKEPHAVMPDTVEVVKALKVLIMYYSTPAQQKEFIEHDRENS